MDEKNGMLLSALVGLARASENNEHKLTKDTNRLVIDSLVTLSEEDIDSRVLEYLLLNIRSEKKRLVPDCFACSSPCGRTKDYDISRLEKDNDNIKRLKTELLENLIKIAKMNPHDDEKSISVLYKGLYHIGLEDVTTGLLSYVRNEVKGITDQI